jgi:hypothetical protein
MITKTTTAQTTNGQTTAGQTTNGHDTIVAGTIGTGGCPIARSDGECRRRASQFLTELIGSPPDDLVWDDTHRLQGHGHLGSHELVVIAPRDDDHETVVVTSEDWGAIRRSTGSQRRALLDAAIMRDHSRLVATLFGRTRPPADLTFAA